MRVIYGNEEYRDILQIVESEGKVTLVQAMCPCGNYIELESSVELKVQAEQGLYPELSSEEDIEKSEFLKAK